MLNEPDAMTLHALSEALKKFNSPLPEKLGEQIKQVGKDLAEHTDNKNEPASLYDLLDELEENPDYQTLFELYQQESSHLHEQQGKRERNKGKPISESNPLPPFNPLENVAVNIDYLNNWKPNDKNPPNPSTGTQDKTIESELLGRF